MTARHDQVTIAAPAKGRSEIIHILATDLPEHKETWCGRDATEWNIIRGELTEGQFVNSAYSCKRCVRIMTK